MQILGAIWRQVKAFALKVIGCIKGIYEATRKRVIRAKEYIAEKVSNFKAGRA